ncbi:MULTISPECIES: DUF2249 domain-containing protein [unclassified Sinorhizobium]|uniref:DUF2249 domain-containing protein n=1 Tax=unclassified Sinorhizobium TaxID=2613772 RepID=UPI0024C43916|nr:MULTISPECIES: DUF2249 domain-containing protein [unclassified Sinorhizobium]MDK1377663.1 DUF2249 domain-containing protein [Sinorhizobium sp. 6-70]MDK1481031.1 DUF2249 domain-containing protein [Sinorhizobium sp. 6-117]
MTIEPHELDVRPILRGGGDPFQVIMNAADNLVPGQALRLIASFRPVPLFSVMAGRGFSHQEEALGNGDWAVLFTPQEQVDDIRVSGGDMNLDGWPDPTRQLDLTDLDPPEPMVRILAALEKMEVGEVLFALLAREPLFLYPELAKRGHRWAGNFDVTGEVYRILIRVGKPDHHVGA